MRKAVGFVLGLLILACGPAPEAGRDPSAPDAVVAATAAVAHVFTIDPILDRVKTSGGGAFSERPTEHPEAARRPSFGWAPLSRRKSSDHRRLHTRCELAIRALRKIRAPTRIRKR